MILVPRQLTLFPYTTLFRSVLAGVAVLFRGGPGPAGERVASAPKPAVINQKRDTPAVFDKESAPAPAPEARLDLRTAPAKVADRKSTRLNSSHMSISYAVFC